MFQDKRAKKIVINDDQQKSTYPIVCQKLHTNRTAGCYMATTIARISKVIE